LQNLQGNSSKPTAGSNSTAATSAVGGIINTIA
jgi:hypothetical protein